MVEKTNQAIKAVAEENNFTYIFDVSAGMVLYYEKGELAACHDASKVSETEKRLSTLVIDELKKEPPPPPPPPATAPPASPPASPSTPPSTPAAMDDKPSEPPAMDAAGR